MLFCCSTKIARIGPIMEPIFRKIVERATRQEKIALSLDFCRSSFVVFCSKRQPRICLFLLILGAILLPIETLSTATPSAFLALNRNDEKIDKFHLRLVLCGGKLETGFAEVFIGLQGYFL